MDMANFSDRNKERCEDPEGFNHKIESWTLSDWMTALAGEIGEAANVIKKLNRCRIGTGYLNNKSEEELLLDLRDELADAFIYLDLLCRRVGFLLQDAVLNKFNKTSSKIGYKKVCE